VAAEVPELVVPELELEPVVPGAVAAEVADLTEPVAAEVASVTAEVTGAAAEVADERPELELEAAGPAADAVDAEVAACACCENTSRMVRIPAAKIATCTAR
jgi:hypothetical protein